MKRIAILSILAFAAIVVAQPPATSWPTYHGDNSGRRFSPLTRINDKNISGLTSAWSFRTGVRGAVKSTPRRAAAKLIRLALPARSGC